MKHVSISEVRKNIFNLFDNVVDSHEPLYIKTKKDAVIVLSVEDYNALEETLYLQSVPGFVEEVKEAIEQPIETCTKWEDFKKSL